MSKQALVLSSIGELLAGLETDQPPMMLDWRGWSMVVAETGAIPGASITYLKPYPTGCANGLSSR